LRIDRFARKPHLARVSAKAPPSWRQVRLRPKRMMEERRKHPRTEINHLGHILCGRRGDALPGAEHLARGRSSRGRQSCLRAAALSPCFANDASAVYECRIAWIQKNRVG
jgi:hypothetical protein